MKSFALPGCLLLAALCASCREGAFTQQQVEWEVQCDLQIVSVPQDLALPLIDSFRDPRRVEGAYKDLQKLLAENRATLIGWPSVTTRSHQRAVVEQIEEVRYAAAYAPPSVGVTPSLLVDQPIKVEPKIDVTAFDSMPTEFETRNTGVTFEVDPIVAADGETIRIEMVPQSVRLLGWTNATMEKDRPAQPTISQPRFSTSKVNTSITFRNGERKLIGVFKESEPSGNIELFILRIDATKRKVAVDATAPAPFAAPAGLAPGPPQAPGTSTPSPPQEQ